MALGFRFSNITSAATWIMIDFHRYVVVFRHGDPLEADIFDDAEGNGMEGMGPLEVEDEFYPESSQWEAEEEEEEDAGEEKVKNPPPTAAPITERVMSAYSCLCVKIRALFCGVCFNFSRPCLSEN